MLMLDRRPYYGQVKCYPRLGWFSHSPLGAITVMTVKIVTVCYCFETTCVEFSFFIVKM